MNPAQAWIFCRPSFHYWLSSVHYCEDRFHIHVFIRSSNIWLSYFHSRLNYTLQENVFLRKNWNTRLIYRNVNFINFIFSISQKVFHFAACRLSFRLRLAKMQWTQKHVTRDAHETHTRRRHYILLFSYTCPIASTELPFISCFQKKCFSSSLALAFLVESNIMPYVGDTLGHSLRRLRRIWSRRSAHKVVRCVNSPFSQVKN